MTGPQAWTAPPEWPAGSIASACESNAWLPGEFVSLAALAAEFVADETRFEGPLKGGATPAQSWMTSGSALARQAATQSWEAARASLAVGGTMPARGLEAALRRLLDCSRDAGTEDRHGGMFAYAPTGALPASALAAFVCASINPGLTWMPTSPQFAALERMRARLGGRQHLRLARREWRSFYQRRKRGQYAGAARCEARNGEAGRSCAGGGLLLRPRSRALLHSQRSGAVGRGAGENHQGRLRWRRHTGSQRSRQ